MTSRALTPRKKQECAAAYLMIAPMVVGILVFFIIPTIWSIALSFTEGPDYVTYSFVGLKNYQTLLAPGSDMWQELLNTFYEGCDALWAAAFEGYNTEAFLGAANQGWAMPLPAADKNTQEIFTKFDNYMAEILSGGNVEENLAAMQDEFNALLAE